MDINSGKGARDRQQLGLLKKIKKKEFKGVNFMAVVWCGEKSGSVQSSRPGSPSSLLQSCLTLAIFFMCKIGVMLLGNPSVVMSCIKRRA